MKGVLRKPFKESIGAASVSFSPPLGNDAFPSAGNGWGISFIFSEGRGSFSGRANKEEEQARLLQVNGQP
jgi:hypothetical protein